MATIKIFVPALEILIASAPSRDLSGQGVDPAVDGLVDLSKEIADADPQRFVVVLQPGVPCRSSRIFFSWRSSVSGTPSSDRRRSRFS